MYQSTRIIISLGILAPLVCAAVNDVFVVKSGTTKGGCDGKGIDKWFSDAQTLAASASTGAAATDEDSRKYLMTFFSIKPTDDATQAGDPIKQVASVLDGSVQPPGGKPRLFCNSDWLEEQKWTDIAYDPSTGKPRTDKKTVQEIFTSSKGESPFWSDDLRQYLKADPGDYCSNKNYLAATQDQTAPSTITLCINNFPDSQGDTLADIPAVNKEKVSISTLQVHSLTLFHELFHLALGTANTPDSSYKLSSIVRFGTPKATTNPESYTFYSLAYYLGQKTQYTFANSKSANKAPKPKRYISEVGRLPLNIHSPNTQTPRMVQVIRRFPNSTVPLSSILPSTFLLNSSTISTLQSFSSTLSSSSDTLTVSSSSISLSSSTTQSISSTSSSSSRSSSTGHLSTIVSSTGGSPSSSSTSTTGTTPIPLTTFPPPSSVSTSSVDAITTNTHTKIGGTDVPILHGCFFCPPGDTGLVLFGIPAVPGVYPPPPNPPVPNFPSVTIDSGGNPTVQSTDDSPTKTDSSKKSSTSSHDSTSKTSTNSRSSSSSSSSAPASTMVAVQWEAWESTEESSAEDDDAADYAQSQINAAFEGTSSSSGTSSSTSSGSNSTASQTLSSPRISTSNLVSTSKPMSTASTPTTRQPQTTISAASPAWTSEYSQLCKDWDIKDDHLLVATCTDEGGKNITTQEDLNLCLHYNDGSLLPTNNGQFQQNCDNCFFNPVSSVDHSTLWCVCKNDNDPFNKSASVKLDNLMTVQYNGYLSCFGHISALVS